MIGFLLERFQAAPDAEAIVWRDRSCSYGELSDRVARWTAYLEEHGVPAGAVVGLRADFSPNGIAIFLALAARACVVVLISPAARAKEAELIATAECELVIGLADDDQVALHATGVRATHALLEELRRRRTAGLIIFSSGSTGKSKAALHDLAPLLEKFHLRREGLRTITFLLFDHIGGINTMLLTLSNGGTIITLAGRTPSAVLEAVERHRAELLPTSPTFLNLLLLSKAHERHDLGSLKLISYGTEPMPQSTLARVHEALPGVKLLQLYGLSELGIMRTKSRGPESIWVRVGGEGCETRVVDGILQIKARSAMLGYLNAPSPFTDDGWFDTGDAVEVDGEFLKILGRRSELINVGGEKVYPAEVESFLQTLPNVAEVTVYPEKNALVGNMVCARIRLGEPEDPRAATARIRQACRAGLKPHQAPVRIRFDGAEQHTERWKKARGA
jgi:long-chain acyl-CoA synthetase